MQSDLAHRSCSMDVLLVRTVEKVVDAVQGKLRKTEWNAPLAKAAGLKVLQVSTHFLLCMLRIWVSFSDSHVCLLSPRLACKLQCLRRKDYRHAQCSLQHVQSQHSPPCVYTGYMCLCSHCSQAMFDLTGGCASVQDALPVIMDLQLCARRQTSPSASTCCSADASSVHFSRKYMDVMVGEVQQALKDEGRDEAAQQAKALLSSSVSAAQATSGDSAAQDSDQGPAASMPLLS